MLLNFRHKRTSSNKSATSFSSIGEVGEHSATGIRLTSPSMSSNVQLLKEGPELNYGGKNIKKHKIFVIITKILIYQKEFIENNSTFFYYKP